MPSCEETLEYTENSQITFCPEWNDICRTCLQSGATQSLFELDQRSRIPYSEKVMQCTNVTVREEDTLPDRICLSCIEQLDVAYRFRTNCISSNDALQSYVSRNSLAEKPTPSQESQRQCTEEIAVQVGLDVLYTFKPPSGLKVRLIQRESENAEASSRENRNLQVDSKPATEDDAEIVDNLFRNANHVLPQAASGVESKCEELQRLDYSEGATVMDEEIYETEASCMSKFDSTDVTAVRNGHSTKGLISDPSPPRNVCTLETIRKTNIPNEIKPTIETVTTQPGADGSGIVTVIRVKRNLTAPVKTHICQLCNVTYKTKHALHTHLRRHQGDRPYKCDHCGKSFVVPFELHRHLRTHTGQKPYKCQYCDRSYSDFGSKIKHERIHTGERPYKCQYCSKTFSYSHVLTNHLHTHTGVKKYSCTICDKKCTKSHHLKAHYNTYHSEVMKRAVQQSAGAGNESGNVTFTPHVLDGTLIVPSSESPTGAESLLRHRSGNGIVVDAYGDSSSRLVATEWTLEDITLHRTNSPTDIERSSGGPSVAAVTSVVTIDPEELENVSIVGLGDYMMKTDGLDGLIVNGATDDGLVTVLLPKSTDSDAEPTFANIQIING